MFIQDRRSKPGKRKGGSFLGVICFRNGSKAEQNLKGGFITGTFPLGL